MLMFGRGTKKNGKIITIEKDEEFASIAKKFFNKSKYKEKISLLIEDASEQLKTSTKKLI